MTITALAVAFLFLIIVIVVAAQWLFTQKAGSLRPANNEQCTICRSYFDKNQLVERQIGDYKMLYFCRQCVEALCAEAKSKFQEPKSK